MSKRLLIHPSILHDKILKRTAHATRVARAATGGSFVQVKIPGTPPVVLWDYDDVAEWCARCVRPWTEKQAADLLAAAKPESFYTGGTSE